MQKKIAYLFPGQGAQYPGMGKDLFDKFASARKVFKQAESILGIPLGKICFSGKPEELKSTSFCQPAVLTVSLASLACLRQYCQDKDRDKCEGLLSPAFCAGLSLGEYSALVASGALSFEDALILVRKRGQFMEEAARETPGKMVAVIGLDKEKVARVCQNNNVFLANLNCPGQVVISGETKAIAQAAQELKSKGALKVIPLEVSGAFHSPLMNSACEKLKQELSSYSMNPKHTDIVFNATASTATATSDIKENLVKQVASTVLWEDSVRLMIKKGTSFFIEIGPGKVLKGLLRHIALSLETYNIENPKDLDIVYSKVEN